MDRNILNTELGAELIKPLWALHNGRDSDGLWVEFEQLGKTRQGLFATIRR